LYSRTEQLTYCCCQLKSLNDRSAKWRHKVILSHSAHCDVVCSFTGKKYSVYKYVIALVLPARLKYCRLHEPYIIYCILSTVTHMHLCDAPYIGIKKYRELDNIYTAVYIAVFTISTLSINHNLLNFVHTFVWLTD